MSSSEEDLDDNVFTQQRSLFKSGLDAFMVALHRWGVHGKHFPKHTIAETRLLTILQDAPWTCRLPLIRKLVTIANCMQAGGAVHPGGGGGLLHQGGGVIPARHPAVAAHPQLPVRDTTWAI